MKALALKQINKNPKQLNKILEQDDLLLITKQKQPLGILIPFSSHVIEQGLIQLALQAFESSNLTFKQLAKAQFDTKQQERKLEQAYRDAAQEFDTSWEITTSDGLSNETW